MKTKIMKRIVTFVLALTMVCTTSAVGVLAATHDPTPVINISPGDTNTITPEKVEGSDAKEAVGKRFEAYQIFSGELGTATEDDELVNIDWGNALVKTTTDGKKDYSLVLKFLENLSNVDNWAQSGVQSKFAAIFTDVKSKIEGAGSDDDKAAAAKGAALKVSKILNDPANGFENKSNVSIATEVQKFAKVVSDTVTAAVVKDDYEITGTEISEKYHKYQSVWETNKWVIRNIPVGYYFINDVLSLDGYENDATAPFMLDVFRTVDKTMKSTAPTLDKSITGVADLTDSVDKSGNVSSDGNAAEANIGDIVSYQLLGGLPASLVTYYDTYAYTFHDTLDAGLDIVTASTDFAESDITVALSMDAGTNWLTIDPEIYEATFDASGRNLTVKFSDLVGDYFKSAGAKGYNQTRNSADNYVGTSSTPFSGADFGVDQFNQWSERAQIRVTYKAKLNKAAVTGSKGNANTAYVEYTNNPNTEGTGTSNTTKESPKVYTYQLNLHKLGSDQADNAFLAGAEFQVSRTYKGKTQYAIFAAKGSTDYEYTITEWVAKEAIGGKNATITTVNGHDLVIAGLEAGTYTFEEIKAPNNYDLADPFTVTLTDAAIDGTLESVDAKFIGDNPYPDGEVKGQVGTTDLSDREAAHVTVTDIRASILPHTGGSGVYFYYIAGGVLVAAALVLLVVSRRRSRRSA